ncbi:MAG: sulfite exporter TauE/SafE family protein, partial [Gemmatimonadota bacterium]|nr:sulfite exporter TauE/SafE family protein [Gemmatimonadota bacterium]
ANPWARLVVGNLLLIFGLFMLDVLPIKVPSAITEWTNRTGGGSYVAVFLLGATSGIVAAPCGAPAFAVVLTWVGTTQSALLGFLYLLVFSIGMTSLLIVVGLSSGFLMKLPKPGSWMVTIKKIAGLVMILMAEYYFFQAGSVW